METLLHNLVQATGWSILHSLWQSALIYAVLAPFQMKVFGLNARQKYALAYGSICLMFASFVFTFTLAFQWPSQHVPQNFAANAIVLPAAMPTNLAKYVEMVFPYLVLFYSLGLAIQSLLVVQGYRKVQALKKAAHSMIPATWNSLFENLKKELNIKKHIDFHLSDHVSVPLVIGFFKPVILFPIALAAQMDLKQVETILIHELSHIRRNDYFFNLIRTMIDTLLFFNPFVWLAGRFINIEREHACDDLVVKVTHTPLTYAHALLTLELITDKSSPALALAATGTNQHLYQRIKRITDMKTTYANSKQKLFAVSLTLATIISLAWINPAEKEKTMKTVSKTKNMILASSEICLQDTTKKKSKKAFKIVNTDSVYIPAPPAPPAPTGKIPAAPKASIKIVIAPQEPVAPASPDTDITIAPLADLSNMIVNFSYDVKDMTMAHFNGQNPEDVKKMQAELEKKGIELQRKFNSPEQKAKWAKIAAEMKAKYDNPKERAKWEKLAKQAEAKANSPEQRELIRKVQIQAKMAALDAQKMINDPEFKKNLQSITVTRQQPMRIIIENEDTQKVKQTPEYLELKKKFDKDVEELVNKKNKKEEN
ncbi:BlaR1 peptidase M56 [Pedobacter westerhofensis]|uniref:BlaR1 peptidase M56 n=1 Tax=Pedobacter westerhofensis TaxID=425512 RepID=A0A521D6P5_9SPHI|nr:M56 family metallopeptidase [Pedobacter westerhofensis]SMO67295.1 BlaR1 peptidase M56 [Pedobacter westerhofensis]